MEETATKKVKGGRPRKAIKRNRLLGVKCMLVVRTAIEYKAKSFCLTTSEYLRQIGLSGKGNLNRKVLPKKVMQLSATLNHMAANLEPGCIETQQYG